MRPTANAGTHPRLPGVTSPNETGNCNRGTGVLAAHLLIDQSALGVEFNATCVTKCRSRQPRGERRVQTELSRSRSEA